MKKNTLTIGTRGSKLALIYAEKVKNELNKFFPNDIKLKKILTNKLVVGLLTPMKRFMN